MINDMVTVPAANLRVGDSINNRIIEEVNFVSEHKVNIRLVNEVSGVYVHPDKMFVLT